MYANDSVRFCYAPPFRHCTHTPPFHHPPPGGSSFKPDDTKSKQTAEAIVGGTPDRCKVTSGRHLHVPIALHFLPFFLS